MDLVSVEQTRVLVARYLDPGASWSAKHDREMRNLLREDDECAQIYNHAVTMHRVMVGCSPEMPSGFERNRMMDAVVEDAIGAEKRRWSIFPVPIAFGAALAGAMAAVLLVVMPGTMPTEPAMNADYYGMRGTLGPDLRGGFGISGVTREGREYEVSEAGTQARLDDFIRIYTTRLDPDLDRVFVFGLQANREPVWYWPDPEQDKRTSSMDAPIGLQIPLGAKRATDEAIEFELAGYHVEGELKVVALFTKAGVEQDLIMDALNKRPESRDIGTWLHESLGFDAVEIVQVKSLDVARGAMREGSRNE